jgi:hypothetical protein
MNFLSAYRSQSCHQWSFQKFESVWISVVGFIQWRLAWDVLQEIAPTPIENDQLKRLTRRRRRMVNERVSVMNSLQTDLQTVWPGLCDITGSVSQVWYLNFLSSAKSNLTELSRKRLDSLLKIKGAGKTLVKTIQSWQQQACFGSEVELVSPY